MFPKSKADIEKMIRDQVQENIHLDYKDSRAIRKNARDDIAKDVSAFANSDGGVLILWRRGERPLADRDRPRRGRFGVLTGMD